MEWLSSIRTWLSDNEAMLSAAVAIMVLGGALFAGLRWLVSRRSQPTAEAPADTTPEEDPLLALPTGHVVPVLPFENLSSEPDQEDFSDGLTDDIITALSRFKDLFVIARNSTFRYKGQAVDVRQLNKELGARYVLEGSVQRAGDTLRVTAQLLDAKDGTHLWAETYDRELSAASIFAVQDEITEQVVATIAGVYGVISRARFSEVEARPTTKLDAYDYFVQAGVYARERFSSEEHAKLRDALERAVESDPGYSTAWAFLSYRYSEEHSFSFNPRPEPLDRALEAARRAVTLDPSSHYAHHALANVHFLRHELEAFFAETERALALNPNDAWVLAASGSCLHYAGDERGIAFVRKAMKLDPFHSTTFNLLVADHHFDRGEYDAALDAARKGGLPDYYYAPLLLAAIYAELGRQSEAWSSLQELLRVWPGFTTEAFIEDERKWNVPDDRIHRLVAALRKAGLPEGTEA
jgi:adenylate cyclase